MAQFTLGLFYEKGCPLIEIPVDDVKAFQWYEKAANQGAAPAAGNLVSFYEFGRGVEQNLELAFYWAGKAAEKLDRVALFYMGKHYYYGICVEKDLKKAAQYFERSASLGNTVSQYWIGIMYKYGEGVAQDYGRAVSWFRKVYEHQGAFFSHAVLADCYMKGLGVEKDERKAMLLYTEGAEGGDVESRVELAQIYLEKAQDMGSDEEKKSKKAFDLLYAVCQEEDRYAPVSYTHLTLPTIYSV